MGISFDELDKLRSRFNTDEIKTPEPELIQQAEEYLDQFNLRVRSSPLFQRFRELVTSTLGQNRTGKLQPWEALATRLGAQYGFSLRGFPYIEMEDLEQPHGGRTPDTLQQAQLVDHLEMAEVYLWKEQVFDIAAHTPVPRHTISRDVLQYPVMFFVWDRQHSIPWGENGNGFIRWTLITDVEEGFLITVLPFFPGEKIARVSSHYVRYGSIYPDEESIGWLLGCLSFINSPYVTNHRVGTPRSVRRQLGEHFHDESEVSVVTLRRSAANMVNNKRLQGEGSEVNWQHQWWVSGHIRAQWRPSTKDHKLIWVAPYLKGPEDKPILSKVYSVSR